MAKKDNKNESKAKKQFFKDFKAELKKVIWPTPKQLVNNTTAVVAIVLVTAAIVFVLDVVFDMGNKYGISKMQNIVNEKYNKEESSENTDNGEKNSDNQENTDTKDSATEETSNDSNDSNDSSTAEDSNTTESNTEDVTPTEETTTDGEQTNPEQ